MYCWTNRFNSGRAEKAAFKAPTFFHLRAKCLAVIRLCLTTASGLRLFGVRCFVSEGFVQTSDGSVSLCESWAQKTALGTGIVGLFDKDLPLATRFSGTRRLKRRIVCRGEGGSAGYGTVWHMPETGYEHARPPSDSDRLRWCKTFPYSRKHDKVALIKHILAALTTGCRSQRLL